MDASHIDEELIECIDSVLSMFGENIKYMIYTNWMKADTLSHHGVLGDPEGFARTLRQLFGIGGASLEVLFVREIRRHFVNDLGMALPEMSTRSFHCLVGEIRKIRKDQESA
ncbi:MAG: hypothetical protein ACREBS_00760 [Nitrososphaerales archaeon]